ncbi:hypothetical protein BDR03DRAFT_742751 [Suillus americanus]|nr:hypothetical protein BDR03DRAFT_742751 [Suillus americanus]
MTLVSNDPSWWPTIDSYRFYSYFAVAASAVVVYDWILTLGQEIEIVWRQRWSVMTVLYLGIRYIAIPYAVIFSLISLPTVSLTDAVSNIMCSALGWTTVVVTAMLGAVMIARLHAMYHGSRYMLMFLVAIVLAINIACAVITSKTNSMISREELILSGTYQCTGNVEGNVEILIAMTWILTTAWEVLVLCLSLWMAVKHFRDLRQLRRPITEDCFTVLVKSHVVYFASFAAISCLQLGFLSPVIAVRLFVTACHNYSSFL